MMEVLMEVVVGVGEVTEVEVEMAEVMTGVVVVTVEVVVIDKLPMPCMSCLT